MHINIFVSYKCNTYIPVSLKWGGRGSGLKDTKTYVLNEMHAGVLYILF